MPGCEAQASVPLPVAVIDAPGGRGSDLPHDDLHGRIGQLTGGDAGGEIARSLQLGTDAAEKGDGQRRDDNQKAQDDDEGDPGGGEIGGAS